MFPFRISWAKLFSMGEVACFVAAWVVSIWATLQTIDSDEQIQQARRSASAHSLPVVAAVD